ncbi:TerB family tellurite resistance protein [Acidovorax sp. JMULE5]|uniref:tellurite resistance TerB family protein n=1 Tax=Acidovorax sp. JMULE5 TaxID=2518343 RepID=UPI0015A16440|nr:TerB family tellurite resistance protein [Acidovorax sp. JMULE5]QLA79668.1 TerB family tellurite resistance protein [Acidovorax sp. JMULE5]
MRSYPRNSPEAVARIVALLLISDGHVSRSELDALHGLYMEQELSLPQGGFGKVLHGLCEDLWMGMHEQRVLTASIDGPTLTLLFAEVTDPELRRKTLEFAYTAAMADSHLAPSEWWLMNAAGQYWQMGLMPSGIGHYELAQAA